jgi:hypothetical protein
MRELRAQLEAAHAFAVWVYGHSKREQQEIIKHLNNHPDTKWDEAKNGGKIRVHWRKQLEHWHSIDNDFISQAQFELSREDGMLPPEWQASA